MNSTVSKNAIQIMFQNLPVLRNYSRRLILLEEELTSEEQMDKLVRLEEFFATGKSLNWTQKEIVSLLLRDVFIDE